MFEGRESKASKVSVYITVVSANTDTKAQQLAHRAGRMEDVL